MPTRTLIAVEVSLLLAAGLAIALIVRPQGSGDAPPGAGTGAQAAGSPGAGPLAFASLGTATPSPAPVVADPCGVPIAPDFFSRNQVLSYYGNPYTADMGILGEMEPEDLVSRLLAHAEEYDALNGDKAIRPALHIVWATAQSSPGRDGTYLLYLDEKTTRDYIELACRHGLLVFIDLQVGRSDVAAEVKKALPLLEYPHVQLALDPEFAMPPGEVPGEKIGSLDAEDINTAQAMVQGFIEQKSLSEKVIVVHQFLDTMITRPELIGRYSGVRLVIDMDGFGPAEIKRVKYGWYAAPAELSGIKLFFRHDPDLMPEADVLGLDPDVIIYQ